MIIHNPSLPWDLPLLSENPNISDLDTVMKVILAYRIKTSEKVLGSIPDHDEIDDE